MPVLARRRYEIGEPVEELKRRELDDAVRSRSRRRAAATGSDPVRRLMTRQHVADASDLAVCTAAHGEPLEREGWPGAIPQEQLKAYAAQDAANVAGLANPSGCAALAAFLAGESIAPPHLDPLPPLPHLAGMAAAGAVKLAAARRAPAEPKQELLRLINAGFAIASGTDTWEGS